MKRKKMYILCRIADAKINLCKKMAIGNKSPHFFSAVFSLWENIRLFKSGRARIAPCRFHEKSDSLSTPACAAAAGHSAAARASAA
jgi:hypothetical protein